MADLFKRFCQKDHFSDPNIIVHKNGKVSLAVDKKISLDIDFVVCVPQTSISSAKGFAAELNIPFCEDAITKSANINRTFILQNNEARQNACKKKFIYHPNLKGKKIYLIDDSIVRGNTLKTVVECLRNVGVSEIHVRIPSPPIISECFFGIDMSTKKELIAYNRTIEEISNILNIDSLMYLDVSSMKKAFCDNDNDHIQPDIQPDKQICTSCFTGKYDSELFDW